MNVKGIEKEMQLKQLKMELIQLVINTDELELLEKLRFELFSNIAILKKDKTVGYTSDGKPVSKKEMEKKLLESLKQIATGETTDLEDLQNQSGDW